MSSRRSSAEGEAVKAGGQSGIGLNLLKMITRRPSKGFTRSRFAATHSEDSDASVVRGHALFARFLERKGLGHCIHYFGEDMTLGQLRTISPRELLMKYGIENAEHRELIMRLVDETRKDDHSDAEVNKQSLVESRINIVHGITFQSSITIRSHRELSKLSRA